MRTLVALVVSSSAVASADDDVQAAHSDAPAITVRSERYIDRSTPLLHLDYDLPIASHDLGATTERHATVLDLGRHVRFVTEGEWWTSSPPQLFGLDTEHVALGWRAAGELSIDLGLFRVGASVAYGHVDSRFQRGSYRTVGVSAYRTVRLSRWMIAWISLGIGQQSWLGNGPQNSVGADPPPGDQQKSTTTMLTIGTTFR